MERTMGPEKQVMGLRKQIALKVGIAFIVAAAGVGGATGCEMSKPIHNQTSYATGESLIQDQFGEVPAQRQLEIASQTTSSELPLITEYNDPRHFTPYITFRLREKPPAEKTVQLVTPEGLKPQKTVEYFYPRATLNGYIIAKETAKDGSFMLAVEIPGKNGLFSQADIDKSLVTADNLAENGNVGNIYGVIVWLRMANSKANNSPFGYRAQWGEDFSRIGYEKELSRSTSNLQEAYGYMRIGDPIFADAIPAVSSAAEQQLIENFQKTKGNVSYEEAKTEYAKKVNQNAAAIQLMLQNSANPQNSPSLKESLQNKTYVLNTSEIFFVTHTK